MTLKEIAELAGVSAATASLVLNNKPGVSQQKREEILELLQKYYYSVPQGMAAVTKDFLFLKYIKNGFIVEENTGFVASILDSLEAECRRYGYVLRITVCHGKVEEALKNIDYSSLSGIFVLGTEFDRSDYPLLGHIPIPFVVLDNRMPHFPCNAVTMDNVEMVYTAVEHLASLGFREIGYLRSSMSIQNFEDRADSFYKSCQEFGIRCPGEYVFQLEPTMMGAYRDMKRCLSAVHTLPPCVFADNDTIAIGAMKALVKFGYEIPGDLCVIGFDDIVFSAVNSPSLSTVRVPTDVIGRQAVKAMADAVSGRGASDCKQLIGGKIILRSSTNMEGRAREK